MERPIIVEIALSDFGSPASNCGEKPRVLHRATIFDETPPAELTFEIDLDSHLFLKLANRCSLFILTRIQFPTRNFPLP